MEPQPAQYLVAMCDVLGFQNLVAALPLPEIHSRYLQLIQTLEPNPVYRVDTKTGRREVVLNHVVFSDTILYWAPAGQAMELLPYTLAATMAASLDYLPFRAGIAFGECVIDPTRHIYIGQPIIDAYHTEQAQVWMGGAFHPSCWRYSGLLEVLCKEQTRSAVEYPVPIKPAAAAKGLRLKYGLNWPRGGDVNFRARAPELLARALAAAPDNVKAKWENARRFFEAIFSDNRD